MTASELSFILFVSCVPLVANPLPAFLLRPFAIFRGLSLFLLQNRPLAASLIMLT